MPKTVQLSDQAYRTLAALKGPNESFSDTVNRLAASQKNLKALQTLGDHVRVRPDFERIQARMRKADLARFRAMHGPSKE